MLRRTHRICTGVTLGLLLQGVSLTTNAQATPTDPVPQPPATHAQTPEDASPPPVLRIEPLPPEARAPVAAAPAPAETGETQAATAEASEPGRGAQAPVEVRSLPAPPSSELTPATPARKEPNAALLYAAPILGLGAVGAITLGVVTGRACSGWQDDGSCAMPVMLAAMGGFAVGALIGLGIGAILYGIESNHARSEPAPPVRVGVNAGAGGAALLLDGRF